MDAFFASCHIANDPSLKDKPVVVSSPNARAIILTASYPARKYGVKAGIPMFKAREMYDGLVVVKSNYKIYVDMSNKIFGIIKEKFSAKLEVISIDEGYVDVTNE
ncbi:hypothetical protein Zmor_011947 [Zophobas morio]|uniref:UmuC domain-containing protein n=1 Tax=Zophobas morio TaxID=2755281 RepID=A0AA38HJG2_9CUCU|nr:hypothetical protein Zmor_011947 [Zophobas morio]